MDYERYSALQREFGDIASWAIWQLPRNTVKSNMQDVSMFDDPTIINYLNPSYVFVGLNASGVHDGYMDTSRPWFNFHSSNPHGNDYKLRYATMNTPLWGAYITDLIKRYPEVKSERVEKYLKDHPSVIEDNIQIFRHEMSLLSTKPILIALGNKVFELLMQYIGGDYDIRKIPHYSYTGISKESYRTKLLSVMNIKNPPNIETPPEKETGNSLDKLEKQEDPKNSVSIPAASGVPSFEMQMEKFGLSNPDNWRGDIRSTLISFFEPLLSGSDFRLDYNLTDTTKCVINLYRTGEGRRCMGFVKVKDQMIKIFPTHAFYDEICRLAELPEPDPKKKQPHMKITIRQLWAILSAVAKR